MYRLNEVVHHWIYQDYYGRIKRLEKERIFCCHQMPHFLDVARIAYIKNLEENLGFEKDVIYTAAVLHDIGKSFQYKWTIPHEVAGEKIAKEILTTLPEDSQFTEEEQQQILRAIRGHRRKHEGMEPIEELFYDSDKRSRMCHSCPAQKQCNWTEEEKNMEIEI